MTVMYRLQCWYVTSSNTNVNLYFSDYDKLLELVLNCFHKMTLKEKLKSGVQFRVQWLLELMGHVHNIAMGTYALVPSGERMYKVCR